MSATDQCRLSDDSPTEPVPSREPASAPTEELTVPASAAGERLDRWMESEPGLSARLSVLMRICEPVAFAHAHGVVHRDLKPANIMIGSFGEVLVLDWGVAAQPGEDRAAGTPGYMPPEKSASPQADVFALGRILESLLPANSPAPLRSVCRKATAADPAVRYASPLDIAADLNRFAAGEPPAAHRESWLERLSRLASRHKALLALIAAYLLMRTALIFFSWRP